MYGIVMNDDYYLELEYYKRETDEEIISDDLELPEEERILEQDGKSYYWIIPIEGIKYKSISDEKQIQFAIQGLRGNSFSKVIRVKVSDLVQYKTRDKIKLFQYEYPLQILNIRPVENEDNEMTALIFPELYRVRNTDEVFITLG